VRPVSAYPGTTTKMNQNIIDGGLENPGQLSLNQF